MSEATRSPRRHLSRRQEDTVRLLLDATVSELVSVGYADLSVRKVASRAGVAAATAYTYFSSKEHLVAELFWRRMAQLPEPTVGDAHRAVADVVRAVALLMADEPELSHACTVAMLSEDPDVVDLRSRIGTELHGRLLRALGLQPGVDDPDRIALRIGMQWAGAMLYAGLADLPYETVADVLTESTELLLA